MMNKTTLPNFLIQTSGISKMKKSKQQIQAIKLQKQAASKAKRARALQYRASKAKAAFEKIQRQYQQTSDASKKDSDVALRILTKLEKESEKAARSSKR